MTIELKKILVRWRSLEYSRSVRSLLPLPLLSMLITDLRQGSDFLFLNIINAENCRCKNNVKEKMVRTSEENRLKILFVLLSLSLTPSDSLFVTVYNQRVGRSSSGSGSDGKVSERERRKNETRLLFFTLPL